MRKEADVIDHLLQKFNLSKTVRILAWVKRFIDNFVYRKNVNGPLVTEETQKQMQFLIKRAQFESEALETFKVDSARLNLQRNDEGVYVWQGRIQGDYPVYLPSKHALSEMVVKQAHMKTCMRESAWSWAKFVKNSGFPSYELWQRKFLVNVMVEGMTPFDVVVSIMRAQFIAEARTMRRNRIYLSTPVPELEGFTWNFHQIWVAKSSWQVLRGLWQFVVDRRR